MASTRATEFPRYLGLLTGLPNPFFTSQSLLTLPVVCMPQEASEEIGKSEGWPRHNHPARLAITHTASELIAISISAIG